VHAHVPHVALDVVVPQVPVPPMQLQRVVAHLCHTDTDTQGSDSTDTDT
jgi:hypothetical protein